MKITDASTGSPLPKADLLVVYGDRGGNLIVGFDGEVKERLRPGHYDIGVVARGYAPVSLRLDVRPNDKGSRRIDVSLSPGTRIEGRVVDKNENPIAGIEVLAVLKLGNRDYTHFDSVVISRPDGSFAIDSMPATGGYLGLKRGQEFFFSSITPATPGVVLVMRE
jgi:hypothetical protein